MTARQGNMAAVLSQMLLEALSRREPHRIWQCAARHHLRVCMDHALHLLLRRRRRRLPHRWSIRKITEGGKDGAGKHAHGRV